MTINAELVIDAAAKVVRIVKLVLVFVLAHTTATLEMQVRGDVRCLCVLDLRSYCSPSRRFEIELKSFGLSMLSVCRNREKAVDKFMWIDERVHKIYGAHYWGFKCLSFIHSFIYIHPPPPFPLFSISTFLPPILNHPSLYAPIQPNPSSYYKLPLAVQPSYTTKSAGLASMHQASSTSTSKKFPAHIGRGMRKQKVLNVVQRGY
jgi:hypothetical protein